MEYLSIADKVCLRVLYVLQELLELLSKHFLLFLNLVCSQSSAADVIQQLSGPLLVRMIHTRDGSKIGMLCVKHGSAKVGYNRISESDKQKILFIFFNAFGDPTFIDS